MRNTATSNRLLRLLVAVCTWPVLMVSISAAQSEDKTLTVEAFKQMLSENALRFEDYKTTDVWSGKRRSPILDTRSKRMFKTVLRKAAKDAPNYDGKYVVASWHCGTECQHFAIINLETGVVTDGLTTNYGQVYRLDSSLLIVNDPSRMLKDRKNEEIIPSWWYTAYYRWAGERLILIRSVNR